MKPERGGRRAEIWRTVKKSYGAVFGDFAEFFAVVSLPMLSEILFLAGFFVFTESVGLPPNNVLVLLGRSFLQSIFWVVFCVAWHRSMLLGENRRFGFRFGKYEARYLMFFWLIPIPSFLILLIPFQLLIAVLRYAPSRELGLIAVLIFTTVLFWCLVPIAMRFLLVFPSAAVEEECRLTRSWARTRGMFWWLFSTLALALIPLTILKILVVAVFFLMGFSIAELDAGILSSPEAAAYSTVRVFFRYLAAAVAVTALSLAFRERLDYAPGAP